MFGNSYMVPEEFKELATGIDLTGINDDALGTMIMRASRAADSYCHNSFGLVHVENEMQRWNQNRRFYPGQQPVLAVTDLRILIGSRQSAVISLRDLFINRHANYVEVVSLATSVGLSAELVSLGLAEVQVQCSYIAGTGEFVDSTTNLTATIAEAPSTTGQSTISVSDGTRFQPNDIIRVEAEEMLVQTIDTNDLVVLRGINHREDAHDNSLDVYRLASMAPDDVKLATGAIVGSHIAARRANEEGISGVRSFMIGSYSVTYGAASQAAGGSGFSFIPEIAQMLLEPYRKIALR